MDELVQSKPGGNLSNGGIRPWYAAANKVVKFI